jgi:large subunit ribosomal protein L25
MERVQLQVRPREAGRGAAARAVRRGGEIPGVMYGAGAAGTPIAVDARALRQAVSTAGLHAIFDVSLDGDGGKVRTAVIKEVQRDPVRDRAIHVDLLEVRMDQPIQSVVIVHLVGDAPGVRAGGALSQPVHEINAEGLPAAIPQHLDVDVSELEMGHSLRLSEVTPPAGVTFLDDPEAIVLATVDTPISDADLETQTPEEEAAREAAEEAQAAEDEAADEES